MKRIDTIGQNGNDGIHYEDIGESYHDKIKRIAGEPDADIHRNGIDVDTDNDSPCDQSEDERP